MSSAPAQEKSGRKRFRVEMAVVVVLVAIAGGLGIKFMMGSGEDSASSPAVISEELELESLGPLGDLSRRIDGDPLALGDVDAPVVLVEYSDYRCPFCAKFSRDSEPELIQRYVDEGKLRIEWRDMPLFGEQSLAAARAGRAAAAQGKFWEFNSAVYAAAPATGHADLTPAVLRGFAEQAGVPDLDRFEADAASADFDEQIRGDAEAAQMLGVVSTPSFSVNGHPLVGAQPTPAFTRLVDYLLEQ